MGNSTEPTNFESDKRKSDLRKIVERFAPFGVRSKDIDSLYQLLAIKKIREETGLK